jgi:methylase of polypeptide subunit release factors
MTIRINAKSTAALKLLRKVLKKYRYDTVQRAARGIQYFMDPWPNYDAMNAALVRMPEQLQVLYKLFLLGEPVDRVKVEKTIGVDAVEGLRSGGILKKSGQEKLRTDNYSLVSYQDRYVFTELPYFFPTCRRKETRIYIGADSYLLGQNLLADSRGDVLDLCTGSGFQAIQAASELTQLVGVELAPEAAAAARANVILNGLEDRMEVRQGNLYEAVGDKEFDIIYANPPFMPVPEGVRYPVPGDGGYDGLKVLRAIVEGLPKHLKSEGRCDIIAEGVGGENGPFLMKDLERLFKKGGKWDVLLLIRGELPIDYQSYVISKMTSEIYKDLSTEQLYHKWTEMYQKQGATKLFSFQLYIEKVPKGGKVQTIRLSQVWNPEDRPVLKPEIRYEPGTPSYFVYRNGTRAGEIDQEAREFLELCDGKRTIAEITSLLFPRYAAQYRQGGAHQALYESINTCQTLAEMEVLTRKKPAQKRRK